jgi:prevent-host-death family protein
MQLSENVKPISYLRSQASEVLRSVTSSKKPLLITHHGKIRLVIQAVEEYEALQESLTLLRILALGEASKRKGRAKPVKRAFSVVRNLVRDAMR